MLWRRHALHSCNKLVFFVFSYLTGIRHIRCGRCANCCVRGEYDAYERGKPGQSPVPHRLHHSLTPGESIWHWATRLHQNGEYNLDNTSENYKSKGNLCHSDNYRIDIAFAYWYCILGWLIMIVGDGTFVDRCEPRFCFRIQLLNPKSLWYL